MAGANPERLEGREEGSEGRKRPKKDPAQDDDPGCDVQPVEVQPRAASSGSPAGIEPDAKLQPVPEIDTHAQHAGSGRRRPEEVIELFFLFFLQQLV